MTLGEVVVRFGAETAGLLGGISMAKAGLASMNDIIGNLKFGFQNLGTAGTVGMDAIKQGLAGAGILLAQIAAVAVIAGAAIAVAIGVKSVIAAADFQQGLSRLKTGAGDVTDNMAKMGQAILGVSIATGVMTGPLLQAMYQIISANQRGAEAENTLAVAAKGSVAEQANIVDVAKAVSGAMTDYGTKQFNATQFMNGLTRATQLGKLTLEQLSTSMGPLMPLAANLGIHYYDLAAAMATMTNASIPPNVAATSLRFTMQSLENPTKKARDAMSALGLDSVRVGNELKVSLPGALQMIYDTAKKAGPEGSVPFNRAVSDMIGGQRSLQAFMALTGTHFKTFVTDTHAVKSAMDASKTAVLGWDDAQKNLNVQWERAKAVVNALFINIGTALLPVLTQIVAKIVPIIAQFADWVIKSHAVENVMHALSFVIQGFSVVLPIIVQMWTALSDVVQRASKWLSENKGFMEALKYVVIALGVAIGGILLAGLIIIVATFAVLAAAIIVVVTIVQAFIQIIHSAIAIAPAIAGAWNAAIAWIVGQWNFMRNAAVDVFNRTRQAIVTAFQATIAWIVGAWQNSIAFLVGIWNTLRGAATSAWNAITTAIRNAVNSVVNWLITAWNTAVQGVVHAFQWMYDHNYYFQWVVDRIREATAWVQNFLPAAWNAITSYLVGRWQNISSSAASLWSNITNAISTAVNFCRNIIQTVWSAITSYLQGRWQSISSSAASLWANITSVIGTAVNFCRNIIEVAWNAVVSFLAGIWNTIIGAVRSAWANITGAISGGVSNAKAPITGFGGWLASTFGGFARTAISWGASIINGIASGISGALGALRDAVGQAGQIIANILGFHSSVIGPPKEGPGTSLADWGPGIANGIANGMLQGLPQIRAAAIALLSPFENLSVSAQGVPSVSPGVGTSGQTTNAQILASLQHIERLLDTGRPISRYELTQALGLLLAEGVRR